MTPASWIEVSLTQLRANLAAFRAMIDAGASPGRGGRTSRAMVCGVVKADAFGVGVEPIARCLDEAGIDMLAVYNYQQAIPFAAWGLRTPILLLMPTLGTDFPAELEPLAARGQLHVTIHHETQLRDIAAVGRSLSCAIPVHLMLDTGMSRAGVHAEEVERLAALASRSAGVRLAGLCTHLASPDSDVPFTLEQTARFDKAVERCVAHLPGDVILHVANTFASVTDAAHHRQMIRVGLGLYGFGPEAVEHGALLPRSADIRPIVRWLSRIVHVQRHPAGTPVGYNSTHRLTRESRLALVPVGYADGYPRSLSNRGVVELPEAPVAGKPAVCPVLGRVNMDQIVIDVTDAPADAALLGELVEIYSPRADSACSLPRLASLAQTNTYELLCRLSPRTVRVYK